MQKFKEQPRLESITILSSGRVWRGRGSLPKAALISTRPGLPQSTPPDMQQAQEVASTTSFIHATKRECPLIQGPLRVPRPGSTNVELCGREHAHAGYCPGNQLAFAQSVRRARHAEFSSRSCTMINVFI